MRCVIAATFEEWRIACRDLLRERVLPAEVAFTEDSQQGWLGGFQTGQNATGSQREERSSTVAPRVPPAFLELAREVACHRSGDRFDLLYRALWRITHGEPRLLEILTDPDVHRLHRMQKAVARDIHKMHAFVRFRRLVDPTGGEHFVAWHCPDHRIVRLAAPFFARRFPAMHWSILTPDESAHWDQVELSYSSGVPISEAPGPDQLEDLWRTYYRSIFNPARLNAKTMKREMPVRHWRTLPETSELPALLAQAGGRISDMVAPPREVRPKTVDFIPENRDLPALAKAAQGCRGCELCETATQTVFGVGPAHARLMLVGEQPGDEEDLRGIPFVGPAGQVLDRALQAAGIQRREVYLTNTVKHFKFEQRGRRRLHKRPGSYEMQACRPWLAAEISLLRPEVIVCLGSTAVQAILGRRDRLSALRGEALATQFCQKTIATYHPSAVLRAATAEHATEIRDALTADLRMALRLLP